MRWHRTSFRCGLHQTDEALNTKQQRAVPVVEHLHDANQDAYEGGTHGCQQT